MTDLIGFCNDIGGVAGGWGQIYTIGATPSSPTRLTTDSSRDYLWVQWSPDATKFLACEDLGSTLSIIDATTGAIDIDLTVTVDLSNTPYVKGGWAPDGSKVYVAGANDPDGYHVDILAVHTDNSVCTVLPIKCNEQDVANPYICVSLDGTKLAYSTLRSDQSPGDTYCDLTVANSDGTSPAIVLHGNVSAQKIALPIQWYADNVSLLCAVTTTGSDSQLWKVDTSTSAHTVLYNDSTSTHIDWSNVFTMSPDETRVMTINPGNNSLTMITLATSALTTIYTLTSGGFGMQGMSWGDYAPAPPPEPTIGAGEQAAGFFRYA